MFKIIVISLLFVMVSPMAYADYGTTGIRLTNDPQFCYMTEDITLQTLSFITLYQWEKELILNEPNKKWGMEIKYIDTQNWTECDVIIQFVDNSTNPLDLGKTDLNEKEALISIALYNENKKLPTGDLYNIILHELGHSMGLGHYNSGIPNDPTSVMSPQFEPFKSIKLTIMSIDVNKLSGLYTEGFQ